MNKRTWLFILRLKFLFSKILLADVWFTASHPKKDSRGKQLDGRHEANVLPLLDLPGPLGKDAYRITESATCPGLRAGRDEKVNSFKGLSMSRGMLLFLRKSCWHARLATADNRRPELQQEGGQVTSE